MEEDASTVLKCVEKESCGTTACAIGWCPTVFPNQWAWEEDDDGNMVPELRCGASNTWCDIRSFFGLTKQEEVYLFNTGPKRYTRTPKQEARVIENVVALHGYTYAD